MAFQKFITNALILIGMLATFSTSGLSEFITMCGLAAIAHAILGLYDKA